MNVKFNIEHDNSGCGGEQLIAGSGIDKLACDYGEFLKTVLPTFHSDDSECDKGPRINVIVSHGGYIRHCVLQSTKTHPANTQMYLVRYTRPANPTLPIHAEVLKTQLMPGMNGSSGELPAHAQLLYEAATGPNTDCSYTYHKTIAPPPTTLSTPRPPTLKPIPIMPTVGNVAFHQNLM